MSCEPRLCIDFGTALSKAAIACPGEREGVDPASVRPLPIGRALSENSPLFAPCALFIDGERLYFGSAALRRAELQVDAGREPLFSFKSVLSDRELAYSCETMLPKPVDPTGTFRRRDLIVLFLAWLTLAIDEVMARDNQLPDGGRNLPIRFTTPFWPHTTQSGSRIVANLFDDARFVADLIGPPLKDVDGIDLTVASNAASAARTRGPGKSRIEGAVLEAVAAAACHASCENAMTHLLVFDVGAGTTDLAALRIVDGRCQEIVEARQTLPIGGDNLDMMMLDHLSRARGAKSADLQARLWRHASVQARQIKETLFDEGRAAFVYGGKTVLVKRSDLTNDADFKAMLNTLKTAYAGSLDALSAVAAADGARQIHVALAGGGANLAFVNEIAKRTRVSQGKVTSTVLPVAPKWAHEPRFGGNLAPAFPQLAIAIGGAATRILVS